MTDAETAQARDDAQVKKMAAELAYVRQKENDARRALADAVETTNTIREKYEKAFMECEQRTAERRANGQIECRID